MSNSVFKKISGKGIFLTIIKSLREKFRQRLLLHIDKGHFSIAIVVEKASHYHIASLY